MELRDLADQVIADAGRSSTPFGVYVMRAGDPGAELARSVEREVFLEFFGNTPELLAAEYGPYEGASLFICVLDHLERVPAGVMRIIEPTGIGLKSLIDLERLWGIATTDLVGPTGRVLDAARTWDVATLAVAATHRGAATSGLITLALYQALTVLVVENNVDWAFAILDVVALDLIDAAVQRPFAPVPGTVPLRYLDSPASIPTLCDVADYESRLSLLDPATYEILFQGRGLESVVSTPDWRPRPASSEETLAG